MGGDKRTTKTEGFIWYMGKLKRILATRTYFLAILVMYGSNAIKRRVARKEARLERFRKKEIKIATESENNAQNIYG